jgi:hypothetical protein
MLKSQSIEEAYKEFYKEILQNFWQLPSREADALSSFFDLCISDRAFTEKQASYMITLMRKYHNVVCDEKFDYSDLLDNPKFKHPFRVIDENKRFYIERSKDGGIYMCFRFPYVFKSTFDKEIAELTENKSGFRFDQESQSRRINFYDFNPIVAFEFAQRHGFEIDESVLHAIAETETAWNNQDQLTPVSIIDAEKILLQAKTQHSQEFFDTQCSGVYLKDLFLAKSMGYPTKFDKTPVNIVEKIAAAKTNTFWIQENSKLFELYKTLNCKIAVILDRNDDTKNWIKNFTDSAEKSGIDRSKIKVCFRDNSKEKNEFNEWIKNNQHGGKVEDGDIYLFDHKPAKWLFKESNYVKIVVTTTKFMPTAPITKDLITTHPCAVYLSDIKPTVKGNTKLVKL